MRRLIATAALVAGLVLGGISPALAQTANTLPGHRAAVSTAGSITAGWSASSTAHPGVTSYHVQVAVAATGLVVGDVRTTGLAETFTGLTASTRYQWRVAVGADPYHGASSWSPWSGNVFTYPGAIPAPPVPGVLPDGPSSVAGAVETDLPGSAVAGWDQSQTFFDGSHTYGSVTTDAAGTAWLASNGLANNEAQLSSANLAETSGLLYTYGVFEAAVYVQNSGSRVANWPAMWLTSSDALWPAGGEFDGLEGLGGYQRSDYHYAGCGGVCTVAGQNEQLSGGWHVLDLVWGPGVVQTWIDGHEQFDYESANVEGDAPLMVVFDMASGWAGYSTGLPSSLGVAYLRVWQYV